MNEFLAYSTGQLVANGCGALICMFGLTWYNFDYTSVRNWFCKKRRPTITEEAKADMYRRVSDEDAGDSEEKKELLRKLREIELSHWKPNKKTIDS